MSTITPPNPALSTYLTSSVKDPSEERVSLREQNNTVRDEAVSRRNEIPAEFKVENQTLRDETETSHNTTEERREPPPQQASRGSYLDVSV